VRSPEPAARRGGAGSAAFLRGTARRCCRPAHRGPGPLPAGGRAKASGRGQAASCSRAGAGERARPGRSEPVFGTAAAGPQLHPRATLHERPRETAGRGNARRELGDRSRCGGRALLAAGAGGRQGGAAGMRSGGVLTAGSTPGPGRVPGLPPPGHPSAVGGFPVARRGFSGI